MKIKIQNLFIVLTILTGINPIFAQGTAFTYQGQLNTVPNNGKFNFTFKLVSDAAGSNVVATVSKSNVLVTDGCYIVQLDFGNVFDGQSFWLESLTKIGLKKFTTIQLLQTPSALYANYASNLLGGIPANSIIGSISNNKLANSTITINAGTGLTGRRHSGFGRFCDAQCQCQQCEYNKCHRATRCFGKFFSK